MFVETEVNTATELIAALDALSDELRMGTASAAEAAALALIMKFRYQAVQQVEHEHKNPSWRRHDHSEAA